MLKKEKVKNLLGIGSILVIVICCLLLFPQVRFFVIIIGEKVLGRGLSRDYWMSIIPRYALYTIFVFGIVLTFLVEIKINSLIKYAKYILEFATIGIVAMSIIAAIVMNVFKMPLIDSIKSAGTFFLFLISFSLIWILVKNTMKDWRSSFVVAFLCFSVFIWFLAELLSFFRILTTAGILFGWIVYNVILLTYLFRLYKKGIIQIKIPQIFPLRWEYCVLAVILSVSFFIAATYPPNNWDSMTYHLPRIEHWLQNKSLNHYYTSIDRQLFSAPFSEIFILHGRALSGDDYLANLVQWFSLLGSIIGISKISGYLGMNRKMQISAAIFFATVPMAILQASSTQTDLVEALFIICLIERFLAWRKTGGLFECLGFGVALGLSILTKGTAYPIAFPFVIYFAVICIKNYRRQFIGGCLAAIICLAIIFPHCARNYIVFNNPLGVHNGTMSNFSIKSFIITFFADINSNLAFPKPHIINAPLEKIWDALEVDNTIFPYGRPAIQNIRNLAYFHEDSVINSLQMILSIICLILLISRKKRHLYGLLVIGSWCMFSYCIPWQPWITRLQLPLFALTAPLFSLTFENNDKLRKVSLILLSSFAILPLILNMSRPLLSAPGFPTSSKTIWNTSRDDLVFSNRHGDGNYTDACDVVLMQKDIRNIGIIIGVDSWEYPLWRHIRRNSNKKINIVHIKENEQIDNIDVIFVLNRQTSLVANDENNQNGDKPLVLIRSQRNKSEWEIIY